MVYGRITSTSQVHPIGVYQHTHSYQIGGLMAIQLQTTPEILTTNTIHHKLSFALEEMLLASSQSLTTCKAWERKSYIVLAVPCRMCHGYTTDSQSRISLYSIVISDLLKLGVSLSHKCMLEACTFSSMYDQTWRSLTTRSPLPRWRTTFTSRGI